MPKKEVVPSPKDALLEGFRGHPAFVDFTLDDLAIHDKKDRQLNKPGGHLGSLKRCAKFMSMYDNFPYATPRGFAALLMLHNIDSAFWKLVTMKEGDNVGKNLSAVSVYAKIIAVLLTEEK